MNEPQATHPLRRWQQEALSLWQANNKRGIVSAVTGGGKTFFALACVKDAKPGTTLIAVPTVALLDQWWEEAAAFFSLDLEEINVISRGGRVIPGTINIGVLNTLSKLSAKHVASDMLLIVDECHKAASPEFSSVLDLPKTAALGLSATPERPYDDGLSARLVPSLGPVIYSYGYDQALQDKVIVPFELRNVQFDLEEDRAIAYAKLTRTIAALRTKFGEDARETVSAYIKRSRLLNTSPRRVEIALKIVMSHRGSKTLVFHEDVDSCKAVYDVLGALGVKAELYHSGMPVKARAEALRSYRNHPGSILVTCRALDEGFNVPDTEIGIVAAATATRRQRIQRLGRALRPAKDKTRAVVYTLAATKAEIDRLKVEEAELDAVAEITWMKA